MVPASREVVSLDMPVPFETAWVHLRRPELVRRWYGWDEPDLDDEIDRVFFREAIVHRPESGLPMGWLRWHNHDAIEMRGGWGTRPRTTIVVRRLDYDLVGSYDRGRDETDERWITWIEQLHYALTYHLGEDRHAFAMHDLDADRPDRLLDRAGLHGMRGIPVGGAVEIRRPDGTLLGGTLEYRARYQFGVALTGGSLLVVQVASPASHKPNGAVSAYWSTYGLDDGGLDAARERWLGWWRAPVGA
jgi:hypothetical protein